METLIKNIIKIVNSDLHGYAPVSEPHTIQYYYMEGAKTVIGALRRELGVYEEKQKNPAGECPEEKI